MNNLVICFALALTSVALLPAQSAPPVKPATINTQAAILSTKEGQKATQDLQTRFNVRRQALEKRQSDLAALQSRMRSGSANLTKEARDKLIADIDNQTKAWNRDSQDFNDEVQEEQGRIMNEVGQKMLEVIGKYSSEHGILLVADVANPRSPILWGDASLDITNEIIKLYNETFPVAAAPPAATVPPPAPAPKKQP